jgi:tryptophanyl-tRNA synthetase
MGRRILSGMQPTNRLHLGNYLGALKNWVALQQEDYECLFCVVDLHAITLPYESERLADATREIAAAYIAAGIDPEKCVLFAQSAVPEHSQLMWLLATMAQMGKLERMTQFKDKAGKNKERAGLGLFAYPVLMAPTSLSIRPRTSLSARIRSSISNSPAIWRPPSTPATASIFSRSLSLRFWARARASCPCATAQKK